MITLNPCFLSEIQRRFAEHIGLPLADNGCSFKAEKADSLFVKYNENSVTVGYSRECEIFRGIALLKEDIKPGSVINQPFALDSMAAFCDCSRNAVLNPQMLENYIMDIAALGYDKLYLYTEDTFEIKEYPYFGHLRGRFSADEIKSADRFAKLFGITLVPAVQTLAHLNAAFHWKQFSDIHDTGDILLCGEEKTYQFLDRMIASLRSMYTTDEINIGMDEAHMLGLGIYLEKNGFTPQNDIFLKHISRVMEILRKYNFKPLMWSDMFFKLAAGNLSFERIEAVQFDKETLKKIPPDIALAFWNYTPESTEYYDRMILSHKAMNREIVFTGGFRKWVGFCPDIQLSLDASRNALESVFRHNVRKVILTGWGDNGAEGSVYLSLPGLALFAEKCYINDMSDEAINHRMKTLFGYTLDEFRLLERPNRIPGNAADKKVLDANTNKLLLWNDPLLGQFDRHILPGINVFFKELSEKIAVSMKKENRLNYVFETVYRLCDFLSLKSELGNKIRAAYLNGDRDGLKALSGTIPEIIKRLDVFHRTFRKNWLRENKIFGFDVQDIRFGALRARLVYTKEVLDAYLEGKAEKIAELEEPSLYMDCRDENSEAALQFDLNYWSHIATASVL